MKFNKKLTATLLAALILTSATNADAMGWSFTTGWKKWAFFGAVATVAALVIKKMWTAPRMPAPQVVPAVQMPAPQVVPAVNNQANALGQELIEAAQNGNLARVQDLINRGADLNTHDNNGYTALIGAASRGHTDIARALIAAGADLNAHDNNGYTALMITAFWGHTDIAQALIDADADLKTQNQNGDTPLMLARYHGHPDIAQALINAGNEVAPAVNNQANALGQELIHAAKADDLAQVQDLINRDAYLNAQGQYGYTALILAAESGHTEIAQALIAAGADVNIHGQYGYTALKSAATYGHTDIVRALIAAGADLEIQIKGSLTPLMSAAKNGHTETVQVLIVSGADLNTQNQNGDTALMLAAESGGTDIVQALIAAHANLNAQDNHNGNTALILAAIFGHTEIVQALIAAGADLNAQNNCGKTSLIKAAQRGRTDIVQALIAAGAHLNSQDNELYGGTALIWAAKEGKTDIVRALIAAGANVNAQNNRGETACTCPRFYGRHDIVNLITQEQKRVSTPLHHACSHGIGSENIELILRDEDKRRAIETMYADLNNLPDGTMTDDIQGEIAQLNTVNTNGYTARHYLQTRAWMMQAMKITIRTLTGDALTFNCTRGTQIHALKRLIAQQLSTPAQPVNTSRITLTRNNNLARATDYEAAGITTEFHMVIGDTQQHNPGRAQAGPANA